MKLFRQSSARKVMAVAGALLIAAAGQQARATELTYVLIVDWERSDDLVATLTFEDGGDATPRRLAWGGVVPDLRPLPDSVSFETLVGYLPRPTGELFFDGNDVISLTLCNNFWSGCGELYSFGGYTALDFVLQGPGDAVRAYIDPELSSDPACTNRFDHPARCMDFESGVATFIALNPTPPVPEPSSWALFLAGLGGVLLLAKRRAALSFSSYCRTSSRCSPPGGCG
jgi:hypothetical protein